jgi:hypothetical protein
MKNKIFLYEGGFDMLSREELLLRKAWAFSAYKEGRIPEYRYKQLVIEIEKQLSYKVNQDKTVMKRMLHKMRNEYSHS